MTREAISVFVCGTKRTTCSSHDCVQPAARLCSFPVKREGVQVQCDRPVCLGCKVLVGDRDYCAAHGRVMARRG